MDAVEAFLARHAEAKRAKVEAEREKSLARAVGRQKQNPIFKPTRLERLGLGSFSQRVQREMRVFSLM